MSKQRPSSPNGLRWAPLALGALLLPACSIDERRAEELQLEPEEPSAVEVDARCSPGQSVCTSTTARVLCNEAGAWSQPVTCDGACVDGECAGDCRPGASECVSTTQLRTCAAGGTWSPPGACPNACVDGACSGECVPGTQRCASVDEVQLCSEAGTWGAGTPCESGCTDTGCVGECTPGSAECFSESLLRTCGEEGRWQPPVPCGIACANAACSGECTPDTLRCNPDTGAPQRCEAGLWRDAPVCTPGEPCPAGSLAQCGDVCTSLATDAAHCGSCGHDCQGGECVAGRCQPVVLAAGLSSPSSLALSDTDLYLIEGTTAASARLLSLPKGGGAARELVAALGDLGAPSIAGDQLYFATGGAGGGVVQRANLDGTGVLAFSPPHAPGIARLITPGLFVYYTVRDASSTTVYRAGLLSAGQPGAGAETVFQTVPGPLTSMTVVNGCLYMVDQTTPRQLLRTCSAAAAPASRYAAQGALAFHPRAAVDETHLYFADAARGVLRLPLDADGAAEVVVPNIPGPPTVDADALYYFTETVGAAPNACSTANTLWRSGKGPGSTAEEILSAPIACPTQLAADDTALYWTSGDGAVLRLAK